MTYVKLLHTLRSWVNVLCGYGRIKYVFSGNASSANITNGTFVTEFGGALDAGMFNELSSSAACKVEFAKTPPSEARPVAPTSMYVKLKFIIK